MESESVMTMRRIVVLAALAVSACGGGNGGGGQMQMPPTPVNVATVVSRDVAEWDEFTGRIEATDAVEIRPRVTGYLAGVHFAEGGLVRKGELLFTIDDREYKAAEATARADVASADARVELAAREAARAERLIAAKALSEGELEARRAELKQAQADQQAARARLDQAQLNVEFTRIAAPISGRVGAALIKPGNLVAPGQSLLTTLVSIDPVHVVFQGDERIYLRYQQMARDGTRASSRDVANPVRVGLANEVGFPHEGKMDFVDNAFDSGTGTIIGRALLPNADGVFTPGLFARVQLLGSGTHPALLIHDQAVLTDQDRKYVYVVGANSGAERRDVTLGAAVDGLRIVASGLQAGDRVVVNGMKKIFFPGAPLQPIDVPMNDPNRLPPEPKAQPEPKVPTKQKAPAEQKQG
jgi:multidrug efflux system membrane fusion protein